VKDAAEIFHHIHTTEIVPKPKRHSREFDAAATATAVNHVLITVWGSKISHGLSFRN